MKIEKILLDELLEKEGWTKTIEEPVERWGTTDPLSMTIYDDVVYFHYSNLTRCRFPMAKLKWKWSKYKGHFLEITDFYKQFHEICETQKEET